VNGPIDIGFQVDGLTGGSLAREISLPYPPTVNTYYSVVRGRKILSARGRVFKRDAVKHILRWCQGPPSEGSVYLQILITPPDRRRRDVDNIIKPILDALTEAGVYGDDSQVVGLTVVKGEPDKHDPKAMVMVYELDRKGNEK